MDWHEKKKQEHELLNTELEAYKYELTLTNKYWKFIRKNNLSTWIVS